GPGLESRKVLARLARFHLQTGALPLVVGLVGLGNVAAAGRQYSAHVGPVLVRCGDLAVLPGVDRLRGKPGLGIDVPGQGPSARRLRAQQIELVVVALGNCRLRDCIARTEYDGSSLKHRSHQAAEFLTFDLTHIAVPVPALAEALSEYRFGVVGLAC